MSDSMEEKLREYEERRRQIGGINNVSAKELARARAESAEVHQRVEDAGMRTSKPDLPVWGAPNAPGVPGAEIKKKPLRPE